MFDMSAIDSFRRAAQNTRRAISTLALGGDLAGDFSKEKLAVARMIDKLEDRSNKPEIRGDDALRAEAWDTTRRLRAEMIEAYEVGQDARIAARYAQLAEMKEADRARIASMTPFERETYNYQQSLKARR